jgi:hypothetical protein
VDRLWAERLAAQSEWPAETDADRLTAAFELLDSSGIVARQNFTCCNTCARTEIGDDLPAGANPRGYVFFHYQDTQRLAEGRGILYLGYGVDAFSAGADAEEEESMALRVGDEITERLRAAGFNVEWNRTLGTKILVRDLNWLKRLPA